MTIILNKGASKEDLEAISRKLKKLKTRKGLDAKKYSGTIKLQKDPLEIQKELRNEWE